ncbi:MAG TPA: DinB family protein [Longimicrobium sp.]|jgi:hypothetical protein|uniref:DinB family protein n=1 Tax=Longimicrobium sp. TaxID=2029185 RepID=UPI002EDAA60A
MHPRIQEILDFFDEQYHALRAAAEAVPAAHRERQPGAGRWSVAQVMDHVARVNTVMAQLVAGNVAQARAQGLAQETETGSVIKTEEVAAVMDRGTRRSAPEPAHPAPDARYDDALAALEASRERVRETFTAADGLALGAVQFTHPALGPLNMYQWGVAASAHQARHAAQIREAADELAGSSPEQPGA